MASLTAQNIIEVGKRLIQAKSLVNHGHWQDWLQNNFQLSYRTAKNFIDCAEKFSNVKSIATLNSTQMIALLSLPSAEETEKFIAEKAAEGKKVADMTIKKLREAQELSEQVALAKIELGNRFNELPKNNVGRPKEIIDTPVDNLKSKSEVIAKLGFTQKQAERFQQMAKNPDVVQSAMAKARENDDVISQAQILNEIKQTKRKEEIQKQAEEIEQRAIEQPNGLFDVIVIDPPWGYVKQAHHGSYDANGRRGTCPYPEMTQDELKTIELPAAEEEIAAQAKARQAEYHGNQYQSAPEDICPQVQTPQEKNKIDRQNKTNYQLAKMAGVSDKLTCSLPHFTRVKS